jgi:NitT/TauT family transport system substrate-binding protein
MKNHTVSSVKNYSDRIQQVHPLFMNYKVVSFLLVILATLLLNTCRNEAVQPMRIGMHVWPGFEPLFLARHIKSLDEASFRLVEFSNGSEVGRAFRNGTLEAACLTMDEVFYIIQDGMDPVILLVMDESSGADAVLARPEIKSLTELRGKRIAVEISAVEAYMLTRMLQKAGLSMKDIVPVYLPIEQHFSAYKNGLVDAVVTYEPIRTKLLEQGAVELFNSSMIPGEIVDLLIVRRDYLESNPGRGISLQLAWFKALEQIRKDPYESAKYMAIREQIAPEEFESALQKLHFPDKMENYSLLNDSMPALMATAERLKKLMLESGLLHDDIPIKPLFTLSELMKNKNPDDKTNVEK